MTSEAFGSATIHRTWRLGVGVGIVALLIGASATGCGGGVQWAPPGEDAFVVVAPPSDPSANAIADAFDEAAPLIPVTPATPPPPATSTPAQPPEAPQPEPPASDKDSGKSSLGAGVLRLDTDSPCNKATDCASGVCEGQGCGPNLGRCAAPNRHCTRDARLYCGCDGKPFRSSGTCPGRRYSKQGAC